MQTFPLTTDAHEAIVEFIDASRPFALATVLADSGSTPRKAGTKALLGADGSIWGTIGGGLLEHHARLRAMDAIGTGRAEVFDFPFAGSEASEGRPVCGGRMRVLIDPAPGRHRDVYAQVVAARRQRARGTLVTFVGDEQPPVVVVRWFAAGEPPEPAMPAQAALIEPIAPEPRLIIVGGGHVAQALARQADLVGFELLIVEDRAEYARADLFPRNAAVRCGDAVELLGAVTFDTDTYVALVSRGHLSDAQALAVCLRRPAAYIGMMGSRRKVALLRRDFIESGRATADEFDRLHAPIGLELGGQTVPEIAASIVAELIAVRRDAAIADRRGGRSRVST